MYTANEAALSVKYAFVDVSQLQVAYARTTLDYDDSTYRTRDEDLVSVYLYYRFLPNTSAFLEYDFKSVAYESKGNDNDVQTGFIGTTWEITEFSKGTAKAGYLSKDYSDPASEDFTTWTASVDLQHRLSDAASVRLIGKRDVNEGKYPDVRYYTTTGMFVDFTYHFLDRLVGTVEGSYSQDDLFRPAARGDRRAGRHHRPRRRRGELLVQQLARFLRGLPLPETGLELSIPTTRPSTPSISR